MSPLNSSPTQTPLYRELHAKKYQRQDKIREIQEETKRRLLVYCASVESPIDALDIHGFGDLFHNVEKGEKIDLMIQSPGGDVDRAEKILMMCRNRCSSLRVIVPESAKSAATLIAIASDEIVMSDTSELGPIDPQILIPSPHGDGYVYRPAQSYLDGLESIKEEAKNSGELSPAYFPLLQQLDPALIDFCYKAVERTRSFAIKWLKKYMCKEDPAKANQIANKLLDTKKYLSHGAVIDYNEAKNIGLNVVYFEPTTPLWQALWRLHCSYVEMIGTGQAKKIFESSIVSLPF